LDGKDSLQANYLVTKDSNIFISEEQNNSVKLQNLPKPVRHKVEDAFRNGNDGVIVKEERTIVQPHLENTNEQRGALSLEKILTLLSKIRDSFISGHLENSVYERMVSDIIKDYISPMADDIKLNFVVTEIIDSELSDYLNEELLNNLRAFVISSLTDKKTL
jgi:hypothetical protein